MCSTVPTMGPKRNGLTCTAAATCPLQDYNQFPCGHGMKDLGITQRQMNEMETLWRRTYGAAYRNRTDT